MSNLPSLRYAQMLYVFLHGSVVMLLASIPSIILNAPVGLAASYWANQQAAKVAPRPEPHPEPHTRRSLPSTRVTRGP